MAFFSMNKQKQIIVDADWMLWKINQKGIVIDRVVKTTTIICIWLCIQFRKL